jgi:hypothetical protein
MKTITPQSLTILKHLQQEGNISAFEAWNIHKCRSLTSRISDLRKRGYSIGKSHRKDVTGQRYVRYEYQGFAPVQVPVVDNFGDTLFA